MADDLHEFLTDLMHEVAAAATATGALTRTVLVENLASRLVESEELQDWSPCHFEGRGSRNRLLELDGYSTEELELDGTLQVLVVVQRDGASVETLSTADVTSAFGRALAFVTDARDGVLHEELEPSTPAADLARAIYDARDDVRTIRIVVLSNGSLGPRFREVGRSAVDSIRVEQHIWDLARFQKLAATGGHEPIELDVAALAPGGLPALSAGIGSTDYGAYLCVVPGSFLADVYEEYGSRVLEGNVRSFLSARGNVNKGLRTTILSQPERFFAFNNGITATAARVDLAPDGRIIRMLDLQIVNGGQTTASLFNARKKDKASLDGIFVQMKLSVLPADLALAMVPEIARYANTQNKVSEADLFANHPFNRRIEEISRKQWAPAKPGSNQMTRWFYERARAQFQTEQIKLTDSGRKAFLIQNPKDQVITKTDLAKFENTWLKLPHIVSAGAQKNFLKYAERVGGDEGEYEKHPAEFNERWFRHVVAKAILFHSTERIVSDAAWYQNAYRANVVTYAIARLALLVEEKFPGQVLDLDQIWKAQSLAEPIATQLEDIGEIVLDVLMSPPVEGANVTEWAKKEMCWKKVAARAAPVVPELRQYLKAADDERGDRRDARGEEREEGVINLLTEAVKLGAGGFWARAAAWPASKLVLSRLELGILNTAASRGPTWVPSDAQAKHLMSAAKKLTDEGFEGGRR
ncbi:MAG: AIPR family protein [Planctomycetes bacterium]|nr:AIPR family protein [Planctomycetota bacterium]